MIQTFLLPVYALFIGACSGIVGTFYMNGLPAFIPWWWQFGQRFEMSHFRLFKAIWGCADCFSGHLGWLTTLVFALLFCEYSWALIPVTLFSILLAASCGWLSSKIFGDYIADLKKRNEFSNN